MPLARHVLLRHPGSSWRPFSGIHDLGRHGAELSPGRRTSDDVFTIGAALNPAYCGDG